MGGCGAGRVRDEGTELKSEHAQLPLTLPLTSPFVLTFERRLKLPVVHQLPIRTPPLSFSLCPHTLRTFTPWAS